MLLFNLQSTQPSAGVKRHGGGIYGEMVFRRIVERRLSVYAYYDSTKWFNPEIKDIIEKNGIILFDVSSTTLEQIVKENNIDTIYTPLFGRNFAFFHECKVIGTLHGLRDIEMPNDKIVTCYKPFLTNWIKYHLRNLLAFKSRSNRYRFVEDICKNDCLDFVVVSHHTACSFKANYPQYSNRDIHVFYSPSTINDNFKISQKTENRYFLIVSGNRWEKNALRAIIALDELASCNVIPKDFKVIVTGVASPDIYRYQINRREMFVFKGYVTDEELSGLYHDAYCLIYPSLNEGFGYPPLEAMHHRTPVIASAICSIPEVCGDAALYFSPFSVNEIKCRIIQILDLQFRKELAEKGYERYLQVRRRQDRDLDKLIDYIYNDNDQARSAQLYCCR